MTETEIRYAVAPIERVDVRDSSRNEDNTWTMSGYAAVFDQQTTAFDNGFDRFTIDIAPTAFDKVLSSQSLSSPEGAVHFNFGHDMNRAVAATDVPAGQPGSLTLNADSYGLHFLARVPRDDPDGVALAAKMRSGVVRQASFAFRVAHGGEEWTSTETEAGGFADHRHIVEISSLHDVCATPQGMFPQTVSQLQMYAKQLGQPFTGGHPRQPDSGGVTVVNPETESDAEDESTEPAWFLDARDVMARLHAMTGGLYGKE